MARGTLDRTARPLPAVLPRAAWLAAGGLVVVLGALGGRYGFHRDELYFVEAGRHPAFGYPDSPPLVPIVTAGWHAVVGGSLWGFRLLGALASGATVLIAAATSNALGGSRRDAAWTACLTAASTGIVVIGHLVSTTTFDVMLTSLTILLLVRAVSGDAAARARRPWIVRWILTGLVAGLALQVKTLPATVLAACAVGILLAGPRAVLRSPGPWLAAAVAGVLATPNFAWQASHGWPQLAVARAIASGSSGTSVDRWLVVPFQFQLAGPVLLVVVLAGLRALLVRANPHRWLGVGYLVLLVVLVVTGGKAYYTMGLLPALLAAGVPTIRRLLGGPHRVRRAVAAGLLAVHLLVSAVIALPVLPVAGLAASPLSSLNSDTAETVGWDTFVRQVAEVTAAVPAQEQARTVILTANYGEAGALARAARHGTALPPVYSGHNGFGEWGPPPARATQVIVVGRHADSELARWFSGCRTAATIDNGLGLDNDEQGAPIRVCQGPNLGWQAAWPSIRHLD